MKMKTLLKAAASAAVGALMLGATLSGAALAQNLGDLPAPFVQNGVMKALFVVGTKGTDVAGSMQDLAGAIEVAGAMGQATIKSTQATAAGGTVTIEQSGGSGLTKNVYLGQYITKVGSESQFKDVLKHDDMSMLKDTTAGGSKIIGNDGSSIDYHEELALDGTFSATASNHVNVGTKNNKVEMYQGALGLAINPGNVRYLLVFDDSLDTDGNAAIACGAGQAEEKLFPLKNIHFLGSEMEIKCSQFNGSMVVSLGQKMTLTQGQSVTYGDYQVTLTGLDTRSGVDKALLTVTKGGASESVALAQGGVGTVFNGGLSVKIDTTFQGSAGAQATLIVGNNLDQTVSDGNDFMNMKGWNWIISAGPTVGKPIVGVALDSDARLFTGSDIMKQGESLDLPGATISISNQGLALTNLGTLTASSASTEVYVAGGAKATKNVLELSFQKSDTSASDVFTVSTLDNTGANETTVTTAQKVWLYFVNNTAIYVTYQDSTGNNKYQTNYTTSAAMPDISNAVLAILRYDTTLIYIKYVNSTATAAPSGNLTIEVRDPTTTTTVIDQLKRKVVQKGAITDSVQLDSATTQTLYYDFDPANLGATILDGSWYDGDYSNSDYALYTEWGLYISAPKSDVQGYRLTMKVPSDRQKLKVLVGSTTGKQTTELRVGDSVPGTTATVKSVNAAGAAGMEVVPISAPIAKTDSEVSDTEKTSTNLFLFGGPSVNMLVQQLGIQASEFKDASGNPIGKVKLVSGAFGGSNTACVVAGWDAINTRMASWVLARYKNYASQFAGKSQVTVSGTTTSALTVA